MVRLYHGTVIAFAKAILDKGIDVTINRNSELDFGMGFYFGDRDTAERLASSKAQDMMKAGSDREYTIPCVLALDVDLEQLRRCESLKFEKKNAEWLEFVFSTRHLRSETDYCLIEGPMADGAVDTIMGIYNRFPCFITKSIVCINFLRSEGKGHTQYVVKKQDSCNKNILVKGIVMIGEEDNYE